MIRGEIMKGLDHDPNFRWRGEAVTRIENLSDIVFALALGMLISSASVPKTLVDLQAFLFGIIPVGAAFAVLIGVWNHHFTFFRRYGVADSRIISLNAILIFVVLFVAYPIRFAFDSLYAFIYGRLTADYSLGMDMGVDSFEVAGLILGLFGIGFLAIHTVLALMHQHVLKKRDLLELSDTEIIITKQSIFVHWFTAFTSGGMALLAFLSPLGGIAGLLMFITLFSNFVARRLHPLLPKA